MFTVTCRLTGISPFSFSAPIQSKRNTGEGHDDFEERTWRERIHADKDGMAFISPMALKNCLSEVAKFLGESVPGKGKSTYTKHFEAGLLVMDPLMLGIKAADIQGERLFVPSDGRRGGGSRVWKTFPVLPTWEVAATIHAIDPILKPEKIQEYLAHAGQFIGMGRFRPRNNGFYGRFAVKDFRVSKEKAA